MQQPELCGFMIQAAFIAFIIIYYIMDWIGLEGAFKAQLIPVSCSSVCTFHIRNPFCVLMLSAFSTPPLQEGEKQCDLRVNRFLALYVA